MTIVPNHSGKLPPAKFYWRQFFPLVGTVNSALFRYLGLPSSVLNARVLFSLLITQQSVLLSKMQGTQVTISDMFEFNYESCVSYFAFHETQKPLRLMSDTQHKL
jgi:hypothetical protein